MKSKLSIAIAGALSLLAVNQALAFKPSNSFVTGSVPDSQNHRGITGNVLGNGIQAGGKTYDFSDEVIEKIKKANSGVDAGSGFIKPVPHCDDEQLSECSARVKSLLSKITAELGKTSPNYDNAREMTGQALHTIQDFYAHSNYAFLYETGVKSTIAPLATGFAAADITGSKVVDIVGNETCQWDLGGIFHDDVPTNTFGPRGSSKITTGFFQISDPIKFKCIHGGKGTGINKDHPSNTRFNVAFDLAVQATNHFMQTIFDDVLASGIADAETVLKKYAGKSEVQLGFIIDTTGSMGDTITGVKAAISAIVTDIKNDPAKDISEFLLLVYGDPNLGSTQIATDADTMLANINSVTLGIPDDGGDCPELATAGLQKAVRAASEGSELYLYTDADTKNPGLANNIITEAKNKNIVVNFFVSGSCSWDGIDTTYGNIARETGGSVYRYEHSVAGATGTFALIQPQFSGDLQDSDKVVGKLPANHSVQKHDFKPILAPNVGHYRATGGNSSYHIMPTKKAEPRKAAATDTSVQHTLEVDNSVSNMVIALDMSPLGSVTLLKPDGSAVTAEDAGVTITNSSVSSTISIESPIVGQWTLEITGQPETDYELSVKMNSDIRFVSFEFAEVKGREGHEGLAIIEGQPLATEEQTVVAVLGGAVQSADLVITSLAGDVVNRIPLTQGNDAGGGTKYVGQLTLPTSDFRVYVEGVDDSGSEFKRLYSNVYHGQQVKINAVTGNQQPVAGSSFTTSFEINNLGVSDVFDIAVSNTLDYPMQVSQSNVSLALEETALVSVSVSIPEDAPINTALDILISAQSQSNADSQNSALNQYVINQDTDGDGIADTEEMGQAGVDGDYDGNGDGTADFKQANVVSLYTTGGQYLSYEVIDNGVFDAIKAITDPSMGNIDIANMTFPLGFIEFSIAGLEAGETTRVKVHYPEIYSPSHYFNYGVTADNSEQHWYENVNIESIDGTIVMSFTDGSDDDQSLNGIIHHKGGLGFIGNRAPQASNDSATTQQDTAVTINLLLNDSDPDDDQIGVSSVDSTTANGGTVVDNNDGTVTYTPANGFSGSDSFEYTLADKSGLTATGVVTIQVTAAPQPEPSSNSSGGSLGIFSTLILSFAFGFRRVFNRSQS